MPSLAGCSHESQALWLRHYEHVHTSCPAMQPVSLVARSTNFAETVAAWDGFGQMLTSWLKCQALIPAPSRLMLAKQVRHRVELRPLKPFIMMVSCGCSFSLFAIEVTDRPVVSKKARWLKFPFCSRSSLDMVNFQASYSVGWEILVAGGHSGTLWDFL